MSIVRRCDKRLARLCQVNRENPRNRHFAEWRFLLFTMIVTVKAPMCNVIRMASPPFRGCD